MFYLLSASLAATCSSGFLGEYVFCHVVLTQQSSDGTTPCMQMLRPPQGRPSIRARLCSGTKMRQRSWPRKCQDSAPKIKTALRWCSVDGYFSIRCPRNLLIKCLSGKEPKEMYFWKEEAALKKKLEQNGQRTSLVQSEPIRFLHFAAIRLTCNVTAWKHCRDGAGAGVCTHPSSTLMYL